MMLHSKQFFILGLFVLAFNCTSLVFAIFPEAVKEEDFVSYGENDSFRWAVLKDGTAVITECKDYEITSIQIPAKLNGHDVAHIGYFNSLDGEYISPIPFSLKSIAVDSGSKYFLARDGVLFSKDMTVLYRFLPANSSTSYSVPSSVKYIYHDAFNECEQLTSVTIPSGVLEIGYEAFEDCERLASLTLPDSLQKIWEGAFNDCESLKTFTIPQNVSNIGEYAFEGCVGLTSFTVANGNKHYKSQNGVLFDYDMKTLIAYPASKITAKYIMPDGVDRIAHCAFEDANVTTIVLPSSLKWIDAYAFFYSKLATINIPIGLIYIGEGAFERCDDLNRSGVTFDGEIPECAYDAFDFDIVEYTSRDYFSYDYLEDYSGIIITGYNGPDADVRVPNRLSRWEPIVSIGESAFANRDWITGVTLPKSIVEIGDYAFSNCSRLQTITLSSSLLRIGAEAFTGCEKLTAVSLPPEVKTIGDNAFDGCRGLTSITIPASVKTIGGWGSLYNLKDFTVSAGNSAYVSKSGVLFSKDGKKILRCPEAFPAASYEVPEGVSAIEANAFKDCRFLSSITLPDTLKDIGEYAFSGCTALMKMKLPNSVQQINSGVFKGCSNLAEVDLPEACTNVASNAFNTCPKLTAITLRCAPNQISFAGGLPATVTTLKVSTEYQAAWKRAYPALTVVIRSYSEDYQVVVDGSKRVLTGEVSYYVASAKNKVTGAVLDGTQVTWSLVTPVAGCSMSAQGKLVVGDLGHSTQITVQASCLLPDGSRVAGRFDILAQAADIRSGVLVIQPGWNLVAPTFELDTESAARLHELAPFAFDSRRKVYYRADTFPAGTPIWVFSSERQDIILTGEQ